MHPASLLQIDPAQGCTWVIPTITLRRVGQYGNEGHNEFLLHKVDIFHWVSNREVNENNRKPRLLQNSNKRDVNDRMFCPGETTASLAKKYPMCPK